MAPTQRVLTVQCGVILLGALVGGCSAAQRHTVAVPATMISQVNPTAPPTTVSMRVNFFGLLRFDVENLVVLERHPKIRLRLWACHQRLSTEAVRWESEAGWPNDRFLLPEDCDPSSSAVLGIQNDDTGSYLAVKKISVADILEAESLVFEGVGGTIALSLQTEALPRVQEPRQIALSVPADQTLDDLRVAYEQGRAPIKGWRAVPIARGDFVRLSVDGEICLADGECFGPEGSRGFWGTSHRLIAMLGDGTQLAGKREGTFIAQETADLFVFVADADESLTGSYRVVVDVNPKGSRDAAGGGNGLSARLIGTQPSKL